MRRIGLVMFLALVPFWLVLSGCGSGSRLQEISGNVTYDGVPLPEGAIEFWPADGQGSKSSTNIANGAYKIPKDKGLLPGKYKVSIICGDGSSGAGDAGVSGKAVAKAASGTPGEERSPPEFHGATTKQVADVTDGGPNTFDYAVPRKKS